MARKNEAEALVRRMIRLIGDDPDREGLKDTPRRVVRAWGELFSGYRDGHDRYAKVFTASYDEVIAVRNVDYVSFCEHHMLPFYGHVHVAYLPSKRGVLGVSKIARIINVYARRLQIQEQMTQQIAEALRDASRARGVAVIVEGTHLCMVARGVGQQHALMRTSYLVGTFREEPSSRAEVLSLLNKE